MIKIPVSKTFALIDNDDLKLVSQFKWHLSDGGYAVNKSSKKSIRMHRLIDDTPQHLQTDHINRNRLDNRKKNLRRVTSLENKWNKTINKNNSSGYKGVIPMPSGKYSAQICHRYIKYHLGVFTDVREAAKAYNEKAQQLFGEYATLNNV